MIVFAGWFVVLLVVVLTTADMENVPAIAIWSAFSFATFALCKFWDYTTRDDDK